MKPALAARIEKALVLLLVLCFALPLPLGWLLLAPQTHGPATAWLRNSSLGGVLLEPAKVPLSASAVLSAKYQEAAAKRYDFHFAGRELMIRLISELYLRVFKTSFVDLVIGPDRSLIQTLYAREYCFDRPTVQALVPLADKLRRTQDFCDAHGTAFVFVISPSKASIYPESLPASLLRRSRPGPRAYDRFVRLLQENGVRYVDGRRITADLKGAARVPLFPRGGLHWGDVASLATANALLETLAGRGLDVRPITEYEATVSNDPGVEDADLVSMLNIVSAPHYPVTKITVQPGVSPGSRRPSVALVGGSFLTGLLHPLSACRQFSELSEYFYYDVSHVCWIDNEWRTVAAPVPPVDFEHDIFAADALVLEANEEYLPKGAPQLDKFLRDALAALPDVRQPKSPFHYNTWTDYRWGDPLSLVVGKQPPDPLALSGFTLPTPVGIYTRGNRSSIRLRTPPAVENMVLEMDASPYLVDTRLPEQSAVITVNGYTVADWTWVADTPSHRELVIPRDVLGDRGQLDLEFRVARPRAPIEFGLSEDANKYGLILSGLRLRPEGRAAYRWGDTLSLTRDQGRIEPTALSGFSAAMDIGAYTVGPVAVIRLDAPPASGDMILEVNGGAFLVDTRLPEQRVGVFVNGQSVGEWVWRADVPPHHEVKIPRELLGGGALNLEFRIARPASPAEFGLSIDVLKYGIYISNLRVHAPGE